MADFGEEGGEDSEAEAGLTDSADTAVMLEEEEVEVEASGDAGVVKPTPCRFDPSTPSSGEAGLLVQHSSRRERY